MERKLLLKKPSSVEVSKMKKIGGYAFDFSIWEDYVSEINLKISNFGWGFVWEKEHSRRGDILKALIKKLPPNNHISIEVSLSSGKQNTTRADLVIYENKGNVREIWELKDGFSFYNIKDKTDIIKSVSGRGEKAAIQVTNYAHALEGCGKKVKNSIVVCMSKISFVCSEGISSKNILQFKKEHKEFFKNNTIEIEEEDKVLKIFVPIDSSLISEKMMNKLDSPFFKDKGNNKTKKLQVKLFAGFLIYVKKI